MGETMVKFKVKQFVFSSSATVYGPPLKLPVDEPHQVGRGITNPYGRTKYFIEEILRDVVIADPEWRVTMLRYFNPVGAHESGMIGEDPDGPPNNLMPYVSQGTKMHPLFLITIPPVLILNDNFRLFSCSCNWTAA